MSKHCGHLINFHNVQSKVQSQQKEQWQVRNKSVDQLCQ